ncbi:Quinate repressor protein like [Verticillium longisporum]|nr:Quinate repressor protein like [Verticillium longisporum]
MTIAGIKRPLSAVELDGEHGLHRKITRVNGYESDGVGSRSAPERHNGGHSTSISRDISRDSTPGPVLHRPSEPPAFPADVSVVLTGIRGSGKSTLAIIASTAMKRRALDCEKAFQQATGSTSLAYKREHGPVECHRRQAQILREVLTQHAKGCLIVCSWMERAVQSLLRDFARTHPVVHILRDAKAIQEHLKIDDDDKTRNLLNASSAIFRSCSNLEFFNVSESPVEASKTHSPRGSVPSNQKPPAPYLTLKRAERHFLKFLSLRAERHFLKFLSLVMPAGSIPFIESAFPLASIPTEDRRFTYALSVPLSRLLRDEVDIEDLETGADAIEVVVDDIALAVSKTGQAPTLDSEKANDISRVIGSHARQLIP